MNKKIVISGWYGEKNLGDEIILESMVASLKREIPNIDITVLSFDPLYTQKTQNVKAVKHFPYTFKSLLGRFVKGNPMSIIQTYQSVKNADLILIGGGGFLSDWNPKAIKPWLLQIYFYKQILKKKVMLYGIGAGPFIHDKYKNKVKKALELVDIVTIRDIESYKQLEKCGITKQIVTADPVVDFVFKDDKDQTIKKNKKVRVGLSIAPLFMNRLWENHEIKYNNYLNAFVKLINKINKEHKNELEIIFIPMQDNYDIKFNQEIISKVEFKDNIILQEGLSNKEKIRELKRLDLLIGMRLHSIIISSIFGVPPLGVIYHHKVHQYLQNINMDTLAVEVGDGGNWKDCDINPDDMYIKFLTIYKNLQIYKEIVNKSVSKLKEKNKINIEKVISLLD
jgi:polysaccharide pyruvyl transferase CsaB